jgi:AraC-like DNA-binding protein
MRRPDRHNEVEINLLESGSLTYLLGGRKVTIEAGRLVLFWAAIPHQIIDAGGRSGYFVVTLPLPWFLQWRLPEQLVQPILHAQVLADPDPDNGRRDLALLQQWFADLKRLREDRERAVLLEIEARLLRLASSLPPFEPSTRHFKRRTATVEPAGLSKAEQIACFVAQHYLEPLTADEIARAVRLHPNYAMNLFKRVFGTTLTGYVAQHRVSHAQRLLVTTNEKIVSVALGSGFGSISRFNDVFRRTCGCSPREYRAQHRL